MKKFEKLILLILITLTFSNCSASSTINSSLLSKINKTTTYNEKSPKTILYVLEKKGAPIKASNPSEYADLEKDLPHDGLIALEMRQSLIQNNQLVVIHPAQQLSKKYSDLKTLKIEVVLTSLILDIEAAKKMQDGLVSKVGELVISSAPYAASSSASFLGPIGSLLMNFDLLIGIPLSWNTNKKEGLVTIETAIYDMKTKRLISSYSTDAIFSQFYRTVGKDKGRVPYPGGFTFIASTPIQAIRVATNNSALKLLEILKSKGL